MARDPFRSSVPPESPTFGQHNPGLGPKDQPNIGEAPSGGFRHWQPKTKFEVPSDLKKLGGVSPEFVTEAGVVLE